MKTNKITETNKVADFIKNNYMNIFIMVIVSFILGIIFYSVVVVPKNEATSKRVSIILKRLEMKQLKSNYIQCTTNAYDDYSFDWDSTCASIGKVKDCQLPLYRASAINKNLKDAKATCLNLFKIQVNTKN